ncbi:MAG: PhaM family polyhydroxyalkanoate granule multifunctional regulatory protein [Ideonella sp.]|nr:PhaM family polyhydroxyalkanoate granule multifunctional regulatory protein [Ideonella sp.]
MADSNPFSKMVPGFDFLQGLVKNAGQALPSIGQWVAPTLDPVELEKEIEKLRTVQFWLEQNARMVATTIQAMEVQRMTLSTLKTMNVSVGELRDAMTLKPAAKGGDEAPAAPKKAASSKPDAAEDEATPAGVVDPMQWWGALTKQFTQIAATAMKDTASDAARNLASNMAKQSMDAAADTLKKAAAMPAAVAQQAVDMAAAATKTVASASRSASASAKAPSAAKKTTATARKTTPRKPAAKKTAR